MSLIALLLLLIASGVLLIQISSARADENETMYLPLVLKPLVFELEAFPDEDTLFHDVTDIANAGDERLFVATRGGIVWLIKPNTAPTPFLDIADRLVPEDVRDWEQGLLSLIFHPEYTDNGYFYVTYTENGLHQSMDDLVVARFSISADPDVVDRESEFVILNVAKDHHRHNGGDLAFGPNDGYLYISVGNDEDPGNGKNLNSLKGAILRLDVDSAEPYAIPPDNPFVANPQARDEIWAYGLRNPWRIGFDTVTGDLFIADVGGATREEINFQSAESPGGEDYGHPCFEGSYETGYGESECKPPAPSVMPIYEYSHEVGCAVIGGQVYQGIAAPQWQGSYIFGDLCSGAFTALNRDADGVWFAHLLGAKPGFKTATFGVDHSDELYSGAYGNSTPIYHLVLPELPPVIEETP
ncbi:MAG: PQQ-dependent sugar dehydrogenase [Anaerolineae bacterium]|nr:PQQ-dependent sugar dehydrogenase [Anaerolineae bacterium]